MAWVAVDANGEEWVYNLKPRRFIGNGTFDNGFGYIQLPQGSIENIIGRKLTWEDEPVELK